LKEGNEKSKIRKPFITEIIKSDIDNKVISKAKKTENSTKKFSKNGLNIQTKSTKLTDFQTYSAMLMGQLSKSKNEKYPTL
jgi:hypothetical protein